LDGDVEFPIEIRREIADDSGYRTREPFEDSGKGYPNYSQIDFGI
jgi:hypothetical protein